MYRKAYGKQNSLGTPSTFHQRYVVERRKLYAAPVYISIKKYGPRRRRSPRYARCIQLLAHLIGESSVNDAEKREKEKEDKEEEARIPDEELEKQAVLYVKEVDLHIQQNAKAHHTNKFDCTREKYGNDTQAVLRRGQEFDVTITFNRAYKKEEDDLIFIFEAVEDTAPGKNLKEKFKLDEEGTGTYRSNEEWGARILEMDKDRKLVKMAVYIPGDAVVGDWNLKVKTKLVKEKEPIEYTLESPVIILFNPWSEVDQVYMKDTELLKEYILNDSGSVYSGTFSSIGSRPWAYGQFDKDILDICLTILMKAFGSAMTPQMGNPVIVTRALSRIVNDCGDKGVLVGNWSGDYEGGKRPTAWKTSTAILRQYIKDGGLPVKYGQCWVFSHLLTTVCRALGLPCRSVTCFSSAHDTDSTCTIDNFYDVDGNEINTMKRDSVWNFHVWNEVWILRPDLREDGSYDGWHVIDATPQEKSDGLYQCGPCPVKAVKRGEITVGEDTAFVFAEVNADCVCWTVDAYGEIQRHTSIQKTKVGRNISTKVPDGKPHGKSLNYFNRNDPNLRCDLTDQYKFPEGSEEERESVRRAVRKSRSHGKLYEDSADIEVWFDMETQTMVGQDLILTAFVKNSSSEEKKVKVVVSARTCTYWNDSDKDQLLVKEDIKPKRFNPGQQESYKLKVPVCDYMEKCDESLSVYAYVCATDMECNMPYSEEEPFRLRTPDLDIEGFEEAMSGETVTLTATFTNPLNRPLTNCNVVMEGGFQVAEGDCNGFTEFFWTYSMDYRDVKPQEQVVLTIMLCGQVDDDEEEAYRTQEFSFNCQELGPITGCKPVLVHAASCGGSGGH